MNEAARNGDNAQRAGGPTEPRPRLAVIIGGQSGQVSECRVGDPARVLRAWSMLNASDEELHQVSLPPEAEARLERQLHALTAELERSLSPALTAELQRLVRLSSSEAPTAAELRVEYAGLLGWTGGVIIAMLGQLERARAPRSAGPELEAQPED
jgi:hypothetical protein